LGSTRFDAQLRLGEASTIERLFAQLASLRPREYVAPVTTFEPASSPIALTPREAEVICLLGLTDREIAERLFIGLRTVTTHVSHILGKLDVATRSAAIAYAMRYGWCAPIE